jgi:hypothetical protein
MTLSKTRMLAACSLAFISLAAARADWTLTGADFKDEAHLMVNEFSLKDGVSVTVAGGQLKRVATPDVLALTSDRAKAEPGGKWNVVLRNGETIFGTPEESDENNLVVSVPEGVSLAVPLKNIATLTLRDKKPMTGTAAQDLVRMENDNVKKGDFLGITGGSLILKTSKGDEKLPLNGGVTGVMFAGVMPPRTIPDLSARLTFGSGSTISVSDISWRVNDITFKDPAGIERKTTAEQLLSVEILGGRTVFLTELDAAKDDQTSYFGTKWPTQINRNANGQPLKVGKQTFTRGIGVHTTSVLTYEIDGTFANLTLRAGLDDSSAPYGVADLQVVLDGKTLWEKKGVKAGELSDVLKLPVKGGRKLELRANQAEHLDVQGRVDWINVALTR